MTYLSHGLVIKNSVSDKYEQLNDKIVSIVHDVFINNEQKNEALERFEGVYMQTEQDRVVLEIYNTNIAIMRYLNHSNIPGSLIIIIDPEYIEKYKYLELRHHNVYIILTVFNKIIICDENRHPLFFIDNEIKVKEILCSIMFEVEVRLQSKSLAENDITVYDIKVLPDVLVYSFSNDAFVNKDKIRIFFDL